MTDKQIKERIENGFPALPEELYLTIMESADVTGIPKHTIAKHVTEGTLPCTRNGKIVYIKETDLITWADERKYENTLFSKKDGAAYLGIALSAFDRDVSPMFPGKDKHRPGYSKEELDNWRTTHEAKLKEKENRLAALKARFEKS